MNNKFKDKVLRIVTKIPIGQTMTYKQVAKLAGSPKAYRAVGNILNRNYNQTKSSKLTAKSSPIPCHRVIRSDGKIGGYAEGKKLKRKLLEKERVRIRR